MEFISHEGKILLNSLALSGLVIRLKEHSIAFAAGSMVVINADMKNN